MIKGVKKRGQVTIFIIIAILIVVGAVLVFFLVPGFRQALGIGVAKSPASYIQNCLGESVEKNLKSIVEQGGEIKPDHYALYEGNKISYVCYTEEYYNTCVVQKPILKNSIQNELKESIRDEVAGCFDSLKEEYTDKGYVVNLDRSKDYSVEILPEETRILFEYPLVLSKEGTERYDNFKISIPGKLYNLIGIATNIIKWESSFGDSETTIYMNYYKDVKVEKLKQMDGTTIYILTDRDNGEKFQFASRSVVFPPGYPKIGRGV